MKRYSVYVTPICDGGSKLMDDVDLVRFAVVVDGGTTAFAVRLVVGPSCEWNYSVLTFSALLISLMRKITSIGVNRGSRQIQCR
jgi:hypothetical protein